MKISYTKRTNDKILLYLLCINTLQENPTFRTIRSRRPDRLAQQPPGSIYIYNRYVNFCKKMIEKLARFETFL